MNQEAIDKVNDTVISVCCYIQYLIDCNSAADHDRLPSMIEALAKLIKQDEHLKGVR